MNTPALLFLLTIGLSAQTPVYVRSGPPQQQIVNNGSTFSPGATGCNNATPMVCTIPAGHRLSSSCNSTTDICYCAFEGLAMGTGPSHANGPHECVYVDATHVSLYDTAGNPVNGSTDGAWWNGTSLYINVNPASQWFAPLTKYTIPANAGPLGYLDGTNGDLMRRVSTGVENGMAAASGIYTTGCPGACVIHYTTTYDPTSASLKFPIAAGQHFSLSGTGSSLDTCGDGTYAAGPQSPYTWASVSTSGGVSNPFACSGLAGGTVDYTQINNHCGPAATPNDLIGGTQPCPHLSQTAYRGAPGWENLLARTGALSLSNYLSTFDGGSVPPGPGIWQYIGQVAMRFLVDPSDSTALGILVYALNHDYRTGGAGYPTNLNFDSAYANWDYNYTDDQLTLGAAYAAVAHSPLGDYWTASEQTAFLNRMYNDLDDPTVAACSTNNQNAANLSNHTWVLSGTPWIHSLTGGDATHAQLPSSDPNYGSTTAYVGAVIALDNGGAEGWAHYSTGLITAETSSGLLTVSGWSGASPTAHNIVSGTYISGLTCSGTSSGQTIGFEVNSGHFDGYAYLTVGPGNIIGSSITGFMSPGTGYNSGATTAYLFPSFGSATANCSGGPFNLSITAGTAYTIFDTIVTNSTTPGGSATISFTKTSSLAGSINVGDGIIGYNGWPSHPAVSMSYTSSVGTNTLGVINGATVTASATPSIAWRVPQPAAGDCGRLVVTKGTASNSEGGLVTLYGAGVGPQNTTANYIGDDAANGGGGIPTAWMTFDLAVAQDDSRAVRDLTRIQSYLFDNSMRAIEDYFAGEGREGPGYDMATEIPMPTEYLWPLTQSLPGYPNLHITNPWGLSSATWLEFSTLPDKEGNAAWVCGGGGLGCQAYGISLLGESGFAMALNPVFWWAPSSAVAGRFRNYQENVSPSGSVFGNTEPGMQHMAFLVDDPRIADTSSTVPPTQYSFTQSGSSTVAADTGWPHMYSGQSIASRTSWTDQNATLALFHGGTFTNDARTYDTPRSGQLLIWKTGCLEGGDSNPCNGGWNTDPSIVNDVFQVGGPQAGWPNEFKNGIPPLNGSDTTNAIGETDLSAWTSETAGSYGAQYGDSASRFAGGCVDSKANYNTVYLGISIGHAQRCFWDMKVSGHDQFIFTYDDDALATGATQMAWHLPLPISQPNNGMGTNTVTCPGTGGCSSLNSNGRIIRTVEDGLGTPARTHGMTIYITSPGTIYVNADCAGFSGGNCSTSQTYPGGAGYTDRFTIAGGPGVGSNVSSFSSVTVRKLMSSLSDTTLTTADLNPDANWTGVQATGAHSTAVVLFARNGATHSTMTSFTATASGPLDLALVGLTPGNYTLTVGGVPVFSGPVTAGDTTLYANSAGGGVVSLTSGSSGPTTSSIISGQVTVSGNAVIH